MRISWRKGLFRLWLVYTVLWLGQVAFDIWRDVQRPRCPAPGELPTADQFFATRPCLAAMPSPLHYAIEAVTTPTLLMVIGLILIWIASGFKPKPAQPG